MPYRRHTQTALRNLKYLNGILSQLKSRKNSRLKNSFHIFTIWKKSYTNEIHNLNYLSNRAFRGSWISKKALLIYIGKAFLDTSSGFFGGLWECLRGTHDYIRFRFRKSAREIQLDIIQEWPEGNQSPENMSNEGICLLTARIGIWIGAYTNCWFRVVSKIDLQIKN